MLELLSPAVLGKKMSDMKLYLAKNTFKSKTDNRKRFFELVYDYINSPGENAPGSFFSWYISQLDRRKEKYPDWAKAWFRVSKSENEAQFRVFLNDCAAMHNGGDSFSDILSTWLPADEHRLLDATQTSDVSDALTILIELCEDKVSTEKQMRSAITSNIPLLLVAGVLHYIIASFLYPSFVSPAILESDFDYSALSMIEQNYVQYQWLTNNYWIVLLGMVGTVIFFKWSISNWSKRGVYFREQVADYLPPYSLSRINQQYQLVLILSNFLKAGSSFNNALQQAKKGSTPYLQMQIDRVLQNSSVAAHRAINIFYLGDAGNMIEERGEHVPLDVALASLLPKLNESKNERFQMAINAITSYTIKPAIYISLAYFVTPVIMEIVDVIQSTQQ